MAEMQQGINKILLFRELSKQDEEDAVKLVFQTGHTFSLSRSIDSVITKDGTINRVGELETEVSIEAIQAKDDPTGNMLRDSVIHGRKLELWEVTIDEELKNEEGGYPAIYAQGSLDQWEWDAEAEDESTVSSTFHVELKPQFGFARLTAEQEEAVQYAFRNTTKDGESL